MEKVGRRPVRNNQVAVKLNEEEFHWLMEMASAENDSLSGYFRDLLGRERKKFVKKNNKNTKEM